MTVKNDARKMIMKAEGWNPKPYKCTEGIWTIGFGTNITRITREEGNALLDLRLNKIIDHDLLTFREELGNLNNARIVVLINMLYQLGLLGVKKFTRMRQAIKDKDFRRASIEMLNSRWHKQTPHRCRRLAKIMETGTLNGKEINHFRPDEKPDF